MKHICIYDHDQSKNKVLCLDYFDESIGVLQDRDCPSAVEFAAAILREVLVNVKPSNPLWDKIKHAAFVLHLATRSKHFLSFYTFFHEVIKPS